MKVKPLNILLGIVVIAFLAKHGWAEFEARQAGQPSVFAKKFEMPALPSTPKSKPRAITPEYLFACDERTRCGEMTSCEEAKFFMANCPNAQLDTDMNGIPCEKYICTN